MALVHRLDHVILCARERTQWVPLIGQVLGLQPRRSREGDEWGFSNAEFDIGDGFLGLVEPAGEDSQLHRFLARRPEGFYAISVDVGDLAAAAAVLDERGVPYRRAMRGGQVGLLWVPPSATGGVLYQLTAPVPFAQGTNPEYLGLCEVVIAVEDLGAAADAYRRCFGLEEDGSADDERLGYRGLHLAIPGAPFAGHLTLAAPDGTGGPLAGHLANQGPGIFQFTIAVRDLGAELRRLSGAGVAAATGGPAGAPTVAWIDPAALRGIRVALRQP